MSYIWGDEDPLHVEDSPNCPDCCSPMSRHWCNPHEWECEDCDLEKTNNEEPEEPAK